MFSRTIFILAALLTLACTDAHAAPLRSVSTAANLPTLATAGEQMLARDTGALYIYGASGWALTQATPADASVTNAKVASGAAIARSKLATGTAYGAVVNDSTGALTSVAPGTSGNVLTSNGTSWTSTAPSGGGQGANVASDGTLTHGSTSVTSAKNSTGDFTVTLPTACATSSCGCTATVTDSTGGFAAVIHTSSTSKNVKTYSIAGAGADRSFTIVCAAF